MTNDLYDDIPGFDEGELDPEGPSAEDIARFGDEFQACPNCGGDAYDQAELCPHCGYMFEEPASKPALWVLIVVVVVLISMLALFLF